MAQSQDEPIEGHLDCSNKLIIRGVWNVQNPWRIRQGSLWTPRPLQSAIMVARVLWSNKRQKTGENHDLALMLRCLPKIWGWWWLKLLATLLTRLVGFMTIFLAENGAKNHGSCLLFPGKPGQWFSGYAAMLACQGLLDRTQLHSLLFLMTTDTTAVTARAVLW